MKKVLNTGIATVLILLLSGISAYGYSEGWIEKKVVDKSFDINSNAKLIVNHEFGKVRCSSWTKDVIKVVATVRVKSESNEKAQIMISKVKVDVKGNSNKVETECSLNQKFDKNNKELVVIDLEIMMPKSVSVEMENSFGSLYIEAIEGPAIISCEYGTIEIGSLMNENNEVEIEFGSASINKALNCDVEVSYSHFSIDEVDYLSLESEYSNVDIESVNRISMEIDGGNATIEEANIIDMESSMSDIKIGKITSMITGVLEYGNLDIKFISNDFKSVVLENAYGTTNLSFSEDATYKLNAKANYGSIQYPEKDVKVNINKNDSGRLTVAAIVGNDSNPTSTVDITTEYGTFNLNTK